MTDKDKKLAKKILEYTFISSGSFLDVDYIDLYVDAMEAYHEAKMKEVTDGDINSKIWDSLISATAIPAAYHEAKMKDITDEDIHDVSNSAEYTRGYRDGWRDCCKDVKEFG